MKRIVEGILATRCLSGLKISQVYLKTWIQAALRKLSPQFFCYRRSGRRLRIVIMLISSKAVALVGKLGHGKTFLLNKLTETSFPSDSRARSCTDHVQYGFTRNNDMLILDTPGFYSSDDVAKHIAAQKLALEELELSGVYIVVKYARADDIAEQASKIMNFIGDDNLRVIITHADEAARQDAYDPTDLLSAVSSLLNLPTENISVAEKDTSAADIERFIESTLHEPKRFTISPEQVALISSLCVISRKFNKPIDEVYNKIAAASKACEDIVRSGKCYETDVAIGTTQSTTAAMVAKEKEQIFRDAEEQDLTLEQKNLIYGKAGLALSLRLKAFMDSSNKLLSWDVTDLSDPRNVYRKCNYCGAVFNKTEGCDGATTCGAVPSGETKRASSELIAEFRRAGSIWTVQYLWNGKEILIQCIKMHLKDFYSQNTFVGNGGPGQHQKREGAVFESGCGSQVSWNTMLPVDAELVQMLGKVEIQRAGPLEYASKTDFNERLKHHEAENKKILQGAVP